MLEATETFGVAVRKGSEDISLLEIDTPDISDVRLTPALWLGSILVVIVFVIVIMLIDGIGSSSSFVLL
jgi:hypothetical protein